MRSKKAKFLRKTVKSVFGHLPIVNYKEELRHTVRVPKVEKDEEGNPVVNFQEFPMITRTLTECQRFFYQESKKLS